MGILKITGTIDVSQFFPEKDSDADTLKLKIDPAKKPVVFTDDNNKSIVSNVFYDSYCIAKGVKKKLFNVNRKAITIRLQGVDAPELHYKQFGRKNLTAAQKLRNSQQYRQFYGETAAASLHDMLQALGKNPLDASFISYNIDIPSDVVDCYGRFIGDVLIVVGKKEISIVNWLAENGLAYPAFYNSMTTPEKKDIVKAVTLARSKKAGIWKHDEQKIIDFNDKLIHLSPGKRTSTLKKETTGKVNFPKIYRRLNEYYIMQGIKKPDKAFTAFLQDKKDEVYVQGSSVRNFDQCYKNNILQYKPEEIIFIEKNSTIVDGNNKIITRWK